MSLAWTALSFLYLCTVAALVCGAVREEHPPAILRRALSTFVLLGGGTAFFYGVVVLVQWVAR